MPWPWLLPSLCNPTALPAALRHPSCPQTASCSCARMPACLALGRRRAAGRRDSRHGSGGLRRALRAPLARAFPEKKVVEIAAQFWSPCTQCAVIILPRANLAPNLAARSICKGVLSKGSEAVITTRRTRCANRQARARAYVQAPREFFNAAA